MIRGFSYAIASVAGIRKHLMGSKRVGILQSNYIPWKGYFDIVNSVDEFILLDDVQYTRQDWRNRNKIKTPNGARWLSIPVHIDCLYAQNTNETRIADDKWPRRHWDTIVTWYKKARCFDEYAAHFEELYLACNETLLSRINHRFIVAINDMLGITTRVSWSHDYAQTAGKSRRLVSLCVQSGATRYLSGPSAKDYLDLGAFQEAGIQVEWANYDNYSEYEQLYPPFVHNVSVIDLIFNQGPRAVRYMKSFQPSGSSIVSSYAKT